MNLKPNYINPCSPNPSIEFYSGTSMVMTGEWTLGFIYQNTQPVTHFISYKNTLLYCKETHTATIDTEPKLIVKNNQIIGIEDNEYWGFVLTGQTVSSGTGGESGNSKVWVPEVNNDILSWSLTEETPEEVPVVSLQGPQGIQGIQGIQGEAGKDGKDGIDGKNGEDGTSISEYLNYYLASNKSSGITTAVSGWSTTPPTLTKDLQYLWAYEKIYYGNNITTSETEPHIIGIWSKDGIGIEQIIEKYGLSMSGSSEPTEWSATPVIPTIVLKYLWNWEEVIYTDGSSASFKRIIGVMGEAGVDGPGYETIYKNSASETPPQIIPNLSLFQQDDYVPDGWSDNPVGTTSINTYEFVSKRSKNGGVWNDFSTPTIYSKWNADGVPGPPGVDGSPMEYVYIRKNTAEKFNGPLSENIDNYIPDGWSNNPLGVDDINLYEFVSKRTKIDGLWGEFSEPALWAVYASDGSDGIDGPGIQFIFTRTVEGQVTPNKPVENPGHPEGIPYGWEDNAQGVDSVYQIEWVSNRKYINGIWSEFSTPVQWARYAFDGSDGTDGTTYEFIYKQWKQGDPLPTIVDNPTESINDEWIPNGWTDNAQGVSSVYTLEYSARRNKIGGIWSPFTNPVVWSRWAADGIPGLDGADGIDGKGIEFIFIPWQSSINLPPIAILPEQSEAYQQDGFIPDGGWTDDQTGVTTVYPFEFVSKRIKTNGVWGGFSIPALWARYAKDGVDGDSIQFIYITKTTADNFDRPVAEEITPENPEGIPDGWSDDPIGVDELNKYEFVSKRTKTNGEWGLYSIPTIWATYATEGPPGADGESAPIGIYKQSTLKPLAPSTTALPPIEGWSTELPEQTSEVLQCRITNNSTNGTVGILSYDDINNFLISVEVGEDPKIWTPTEPMDFILGGTSSASSSGTVEIEILSGFNTIVDKTLPTGLIEAGWTLDTSGQFPKYISSITSASVKGFSYAGPSNTPIWYCQGKKVSNFEVESWGNVVTWGATGEPGRPGEDGKPGEPGEPGEDGNGISNVVVQYAINNSDTAPYTGWGSTPLIPTSENKYLWLRETTYYTNGTNKVVIRIGAVHGNDGAAGTSASAQIFKTSLSSPNTPTSLLVPPSGWTTLPAEDKTTIYISNQEPTNTNCIMSLESGGVELSSVSTNESTFVESYNKQFTIKFTNTSSVASSAGARFSFSNLAGNTMSIAENVGWAEESPESNSYSCSAINAGETKMITFTISDYSIWTCVGVLENDGTVKSWSAPIEWTPRKILNTYLEYYLSDDNTAPTGSLSGWVTTEPSIASLTKYLWTRIVTEYNSDPYKIYGPPQLSSSYEAAKTALESAREDVAKQLGYTGGYAELVAKAQDGETVIIGGHINTELIESEAVVTAALVSNTINAQNATINNLALTNATVSGTLEASDIQASDGKLINFKNSEGTTVGYFSGDRFWFTGIDFFSQGSKDGRTLRFYGSDIWCRSQFGYSGTPYMRVFRESSIYKATIYTGGKEYTYNVPYGTNSGNTVYVLSIDAITNYNWTSEMIDELAGIQIGAIYLDTLNTSSLYFDISGGTVGKEITVMNMNDGNESAKIIRTFAGNVSLVGGEIVKLHKVPKDILTYAPEYITINGTSKEIDRAWANYPKENLNW